MSGVITTVKGITFPSLAWKKCFFPRKVRWRIEATFFTGDCIVASRESCGPYNLMKLSDLSEFCHLKGIDEISAWLAF